MNRFIIPAIVVVCLVCVGETRGCSLRHNLYAEAARIAAEKTNQQLSLDIAQLLRPVSESSWPYSTPELFVRKVRRWVQMYKAGLLSKEDVLWLIDMALRFQ